MTRGRAAGALLCLAVAALLRLLFLGTPGLWLDEGYTAWTAHLPAEEHRAARANDDAPPLYYAIQRLLVPALPAGEGSVRLLSAVAGIGTVGVLLVAPPAPALAGAACLMAAAPYGVSYSREARSYALLILFSVVLIAATARVAEGKRRWLVGVAIAEILALLTHHVGATLVLGANIAWLLLGRRMVRGWLLAQAIAFLAWLPFLIEALGHWRIHSALNTWTAPFWEKTPIAAAPLLSLWAMSFGARVSPSPPVGHWAWRGAGSYALSIAVIVIVGILLAAAFRRATRRPAILAASFTIGPLAALTILSMVTTPSYILGRTDAVSYAGFLLWCALGLSQIPRRMRIAALAALGLSSFLAIGSHLPRSAEAAGGDRAVGLAIREVARPGDWVVWVGPSRPSIDYYLSAGRPGRASDGLRRLHYPAAWGANPSAPYPTPGDSLRSWEREAYRLRDRFEAEAAADAFLIYVGPLQRGRPDSIDAAGLPYPGSLLAYALNGTRPIEPIARRRGDGVDVEWIAFRIHRDELEEREDLLPAEEAR